MKESVWQEIKKIITAVIHCRSEKISIKGEDEQEKLSEGKERDAFVCVQTHTHTNTQSWAFLCFQGIFLKTVQQVLRPQSPPYPRIGLVSQKL